MKINEKHYVSLKQAFTDFWIGYFNFSGSSTRSGYWWGRVSVFLTQFVILLLCSPFIYFSIKHYRDYSSIESVIIVVLLISILLFIIPLIALQVRRLRNTGMNNITITALLILMVAIDVLIGDKETGIFIFIRDCLVLFIFICNLLPTNTLQHAPLIGKK